MCEREKIAKWLNGKGYKWQRKWDVDQDRQTDRERERERERNFPLIHKSNVWSFYHFSKNIYEYNVKKSLFFREQM